MTEKEAIEKSIKMWTWLADNYPANKDNYPGYVSEGIINCSCSCPCCEYYVGCKTCPLEARVKNGHLECVLWDIWNNSLTKSIQKELNMFGSEKETKEAGKISAQAIVVLLKRRLYEI